MREILRAPPRIIFLFIFVLCIASIIVFDAYYYQVENIYSEYEAISEDSPLKLQECNIPKMDPFDQSILPFIFEETSVTCNNGTPALIQSDATSISLVESSLPYYNVNDVSLLNCCYIDFWRVEPKNKGKDTNYNFNPMGCKFFVNSTTIKDEFIKVSCYYNSTKIYDDYFSFVPMKTKETPKRESLNVLVIGLDGISRLNFRRQMLKTTKLLEDIGSVELHGYNKVGDNTFPNLIPALTGLAQDELSKCWPNKEYLDDCPFIWKNFKEENFITLYAEDSAWMSTFQYQKLGFKQQPTDYYWYPFALATKEGIGHAQRGNVIQCFGAREQYKVLLDYAEKFASAMHENNRNYFGFFWQNSLSHDLINKPKQGDDSYYNLITYLNTTGALNNTAMIVMSDHGMRYGGIRSTYQGMQEERLPYISIYLPPWYKQIFSYAFSNLYNNRRVLTTPFDLHETFLDLVHPFQLTEKNFKDRQLIIRNNKPRGVSLFSEIRSDRSCESAGIPRNFCTCKNGSAVNITDNSVVQACNFTVRHINEILHDYTDCVKLKLGQIMNALTISAETMDANGSDVYFTVTFKVNPSDAVFEAMVRKSGDEEEIVYEVVGTVSRLNLYGDQSKCVNDPYLKLFCYCRVIVVFKDKM